MQTVNVTNAPNSETGNGQKSMGFLGLKALFRFLGSKSQKEQKPEKIGIFVIEKDDEFFVVEDSGYGATYSGPYKREQDAKGVRTRMLKQHAEV